MDDEPRTAPYDQERETYVADIELGELVLELFYFVIAGHLDLVEARSRWASKVVKGENGGWGGGEDRDGWEGGQVTFAIERDVGKRRHSIKVVAHRQWQH